MPTSKMFPRSPLRPGAFALVLSGLVAVAAGCDVQDEGDEFRGGPGSFGITLADFGDGSMVELTTPRDLFDTIDRCEGPELHIDPSTGGHVVLEADWNDNLGGGIVTAPFFGAQQATATVSLQPSIAALEELGIEPPPLALFLLGKGYHVDRISLSVTGLSAFGTPGPLYDNVHQRYRASAAVVLVRGTRTRYTGTEWNGADLALYLPDCEPNQAGGGPTPG